MDIESLLLPVDPLTLLVFASVLFLAWYFYPRKKFNLPPGPTPWPIIGSTLELMRSGHGQKIFMYFNDLKAKYGSIIRVKTVLSDMIVVTSVESAEEVLKTRSADYAGRYSTHTFDVLTEGRTGISMADYGPTVRLQRKICSTALRELLSGKNLEKKAHEVVEKGLKVFEDKIGQGGFDPLETLAIIIYNIISGMCFNVTFELDDPDFKMLFLTSRTLNESLGQGVFIKDIVPLAKYLPFQFQAEKKLQMLVDVILDYTSKQIKKHRENFDEENLKDLIDYLLKAEKDAEGNEGDGVERLTETHYRQIIVDMFSAGTDTSSDTLYWIVLFMSIHPDVQKKLQEEIDFVVGDARLPSMADRVKMPYSEAVMYECLRCSSLATIGLPHKTMCDTKLGEYDIPKGTMVIVNHYSLLNDPREWKQPQSFDPHHFLDDDGKLAQRPRAFMPFGGGKRVCVGENVAKPEIFMIFTALFQRFSFKPVDLTTIGKMPEVIDQGFFRMPEPYKVEIESRY